MNFLTRQGVEATIQRAAEHREAYEDLHYDAVFVSPFPRAQQTALTFMSAFSNKPVPLTTVEDFREREYGFNDYISYKEMETRFNLTAQDILNWDIALDQGPPNGETQQDVYDRTILTFEQTVVPALQEGKNVAVVSHFYVLRALYSFMEHRASHAMSIYEPQNSVPVLYYDDEIEALLQNYNNGKLAA